MRWGVWLAACVSLSPSGVQGEEEGLERDRRGGLRRARLKVTEGELLPGPGERLRIESPRVRAVAREEETEVAELRFSWLGPTRKQVPLASGEHRQQLGLKLRARDGCNVVYVMWRIQPAQQVVVSVKHNPGKDTYAECENRGYRTVSPRASHPPPALREGTQHVLRAELRGRTLRVLADGGCVWEGTLPSQAFRFNGPAGLRTDNGRFTVELLTQP